MGADSIKKSTTRVLIFDSHELVRRGLAALVNAEEDMISCGEAENGAAVLAALPEARPDVVLVDVSASRGDGLEAIQRIRKADATIRIVALAMTDRPDVVERIFDAGAAAFVIKTDIAARVLEAIRRGQAGRAQRATPGDGNAPLTRAPEASRAVRGLDHIERAIVEMIGQGAATKAIAVKLGISLAKVEAYRRRIRGKLNSPTATQLVQFCVRWTENATLSACPEAKTEAQ